MELSIFYGYARKRIFKDKGNGAMGAAARQRGDKVIRQQLSSDELVSVRRSYLSYLESDLLHLEFVVKELQGTVETREKELHRARLLIARLRAENQVLKAEKSRFLSVVETTKRHIAIAGNAQKKWTVSLVRAQLEKARLL